MAGTDVGSFPDPAPWKREERGAAFSHRRGLDRTRYRKVLRMQTGARVNVGPWPAPGANSWSQC